MSHRSALDPLLSADPPPFALLHREGRGEVELLTGDLIEVDRLADLPVGEGELLALVPFRQLREVGVECHDDGAPLRCLRIRSRAVVSVADALAALPDLPVVARPDGFDVDDEAYAAIVKRVIADEIGRGEGANFVIRRDFRAVLEGYTPATALTLFRRLLARESGAYWTFVVHTGAETLVGATPERHVSADAGTVVMNPISGTYRYPAGGADVDGALRFLADRKEVEELYMVVDEELKMMSAVCDRGGQVHGPYLVEMGHLAHTEYVLEGQSRLDVRDILRSTMFAATVTGSPVPNACRVIRKYEPTGRGYYGAVLALIGRDAAGAQTLDAPILIRTLYIGRNGQVRLPVGATLVRHSRPADEVAETYAKAAGVLAALGLAPAGTTAPAGPTLAETAPAGPTLAESRNFAPPGSIQHVQNSDTRGESTRGARAGAGAGPGAPGGAARLAGEPAVVSALAARNAALAPFWLQPQEPDAYRDPMLAGKRALLVDAEDGWTAMLAHLLRMIGLTADRRPWTEHPTGDGYDLVVAGPGPGDPRDLDAPKMAALRRMVTDTLAADRPLLAVCLGHQVLCGVLGLPLVAKETPFQGTQRDIMLFGRPERVGFYNTFAARCPGAPPPGVDVSVDPVSREVHVLRGAGFAGVQFHVESILTTDGIGILRRVLAGLLAGLP